MHRCAAHTPSAAPGPQRAPLSSTPCGLNMTSSSIMEPVVRREPGWMPNGWVPESTLRACQVFGIEGGVGFSTGMWA